MNLKKFFIVTLFTLIPLKNVNAMDLSDLLGPLNNGMKHSQIAYKHTLGEAFNVQSEIRSNVPKHFKTQESIIHSSITGNEEVPLYSLQCTRLTKSVEEGKEMVPDTIIFWSISNPLNSKEAEISEDAFEKNALYFTSFTTLLNSLKKGPANMNLYYSKKDFPETMHRYIGKFAIGLEAEVIQVPKTVFNFDYFGDDKSQRDNLEGL